MTRKVAKKPAKSRKVAARRAFSPADFRDQKAVLKEVALKLDLKPSDCQIASGSSPNGYGKAYLVSSGNAEYIVMRNDEEFEAAARKGAEENLKDEPGMFSEEFIASHIDTEALRKSLYPDVYDSNFDRINDEAERHPTNFAVENDIDVAPPTEAQLREYELTPYEELVKLHPTEQWDAIGEEPTIPNTTIESLAEQATEAELQDPMSFLEGIHGSEEALKQALKLAGVDVKAAADDAVSTDGAAHFMCGYDGNYDTTKSGFIVWRHN